MTGPARVFACSLTDRELRERRALARASLMPHVIAAVRSQEVLTVSFAASNAMREQIETFVSLERQCCGFLDFEVAEQAREGRLLLTVTGPAEAEDVMALMEAVLVGSDRPPG